MTKDSQNQNGGKNGGRKNFPKIQILSSSKNSQRGGNSYRENDQKMLREKIKAKNFDVNDPVSQFEAVFSNQKKKGHRRLEVSFWNLKNFIGKIYKGKIYKGIFKIC